MTVNRANLDLSRFRYSCPAWWKGFCAGRLSERQTAEARGATWQYADWQRRVAGEIIDNG